MTVTCPSKQGVGEPYKRRMVSIADAKIPAKKKWVSPERS